MKTGYYSIRLSASGLWLLLLALLTLLAIGLHRWLHGTKESEQLYLQLGMLIAPIVPMLCFRVRLLDEIVAACVSIGVWFAFAAGFFYYMDQHGSLPAEPCESARADFDEMECRGHYGFENELLVLPLAVTGALGTLMVLGGTVVVRRIRRRP
ncbi:MAG: hypothetical protein QM784_17540 [Polyangiaceae bacterium]